MNDKKSHIPGLTELRINVKGFIAMADKISKDIMSLAEKVDGIEKQNSILTADNIEIRQQLQTLQAKLYEHGIR